MIPFEIFQCVPAYKPVAVSRLIHRIVAPGGRVLLDLEDGIQDIIDPDRTPGLKSRSREDAAMILETNPGIRFDLRINAPGSSEYKKDIEFVKSCSHKPNSIFLPKVEKIDELESVIHDFPGPGNFPVKINPILESALGIQNMAAILQKRVRSNIEFVFFGNYDYHLDTDFYPIREQNSQSYWTLVEPFIRDIEQLGLNFGNSPYAHIRDSEGLTNVVWMLVSLCSRKFAVMSLHFDQTSTLFNLLEKQTLMTYHRLPESDPDPVSILSDFEDNRLKGRSFSLAGNTGRIITPQEYLLARKRKDEGRN